MMGVLLRFSEPPHSQTSDPRNLLWFQGQMPASLSHPVMCVRPEQIWPWRGFSQSVCALRKALCLQSSFLPGPAVLQNKAPEEGRIVAYLKVQIRWVCSSSLFTLAFIFWHIQWPRSFFPMNYGRCGWIPLLTGPQIPPSSFFRSFLCAHFL